MSNFASGYIKYINHLEQINDAALSNPARMIEEVELAYCESMRNTARNISEHYKDVKIAMISGPSSSGKTTTAHMLQSYLKDFGVNSSIISMDNFYKGRGLAPVDSNGDYDYESVEALDVQAIKETFQSIIMHGECDIPNYDFSLGKASGTTNIKVEKNDIIIVEGIHALNPIFTNKIPEENLIKVYVSVKQQIKDANGEVFSPLDLRLVRRIVRDVRDRDTDPEGTLAMWDRVVAGENSYIRPYRILADYTVNSIHLYEPCVLRTMAIPILRDIPLDSPYYKKARDLESRLMRFEPVDADLVPDSSMIREFIGKR